MTDIGLPGSGQADYGSSAHSSRPLNTAAQKFFSPALFLGLCDGSIALAFGLYVSPVTWHYYTLPIKFLCLLFLWKELSRPTASAMLFIAWITIIVFVTMLLGAANYQPYLQAVGFIAHLILTLLFMDQKKIKPYLRGIALVITSAVIWHIIAVHTGHVMQYWGRYLFFGDNQPNLGGELAAMAAIAAVAAFPPFIFYMIMIPLVSDILLLQSRAALVSAAMTSLIPILFRENRKIASGRILFFPFLALTIPSLVIAANIQTGFTRIVTNILYLDNQFRGINSGISGRNTLVEYGWRLFTESPLYGYPLGYFTRLGYAGPHNFFLYGLAQYGILFVPVFIIIAKTLMDDIKIDLFHSALLCCILPLFLFNDRLLNLNPYPFVFFVLLFTIGKNDTVDAPSRRGVRRGRHGFTH